MKELIERLEKATGPDRVLDVAIFAVVSPAYGIMPELIPVGRSADMTKEVWARQVSPAYTSSIDAALTLMPEGWTRAVDATDPESGIDVDLFPQAGMVRGSHHSEAIATCIAALKARLHSPAETSGAPKKTTVV